MTNGSLTKTENVHIFSKERFHHVLLRIMIIFRDCETGSVLTVIALLSSRGPYLILDTPEGGLLEREAYWRGGLIQKVR